MALKQFWKKHKVAIISVWGFCTTVLSLYWTIYPLEQNAQLTCYTTSMVDVFSIDEPISELKVILNGKDIRKANLNLRVFRYKMVNDGDRDIKSVDYVESVPFGLKIAKGKMVRVNVTKANSVIGKNDLINRFSGDSTAVVFNPVFWGKDEAIVIDVWVVHHKSIDPVMMITGRIADAQIITSVDPDDERSFWEKNKSDFTLAGGWLLAGVLLLFLIKLVEVITRKLRTKRIIRNYGVDYDQSNKSQRVLIEFFPTVKEKTFIQVLKQLSEKEQFTELYRKKRGIEQRADQLFESAGILPKVYINGESKHHGIDFREPIWELTDFLFETGLATETQDGAIQLADEFHGQVILTLKILEAS